ncbi:xanthine dehydrogenase family protein subunit M [Amycolatopsis sp. K13G38]|uniref:Xanthine dehydrogenase family protein subunit M n=1 Tax=Amycolatopsis acididurans TaxID=2724524 RepID=A0ABX1IVR2_9PSEU|nr:xanthine dehydrogenase family protein subunit M [Amycolatopsis acididurans]NKQ51553.1 xanthine dehydrogenase family protein subunit M [Amycolatopsis acididurans]
MKPPAFDYHVPTGIKETVSLLAELGEEAKVIAGGQSLVPMLALRLAVFEHLVDLRDVAGLRGIEHRDDAVWVGAATTQATIERSAELAAAVPLLTRATPLIGHFQIRNRGTIGGSLAHADAAAEYPAVVLALDAMLEAESPGGTRSIPATGFFTGLWGTELAADEILTGITFPLWQGRSGFAIEEFARRHGDFAIAGATVAVRLDDEDRVSRCGIGLFGLGPAAQRASAVETEVTGRPVAGISATEVGQAAMSDLDSVPSDLHGPAAYRKRVGAAMVARAWERAVGEARDV